MWVDRLIVTGFWLALAFTTYAALAPPSLLRAPQVSDILLHGVAFFTLAVLLQMAHLRDRPLAAALALLAYGLAIELAQSALPQRSAELKDLLVDGVGIGAGLLVYRLLGSRMLALLNR